MSIQKTPTLIYIRQLEDENKLLKKHLLPKILSDNTEIDRLNFKISLLEKEIADLKRKNAHLLLLGNSK